MCQLPYWNFIALLAHLAPKAQKKKMEKKDGIFIILLWILFYCFNLN